MTLSRRFVKSIPEHHLAAYSYLVRCAQELQSSCTYRIIRSLRSFRRGGKTFNEIDVRFLKQQADCSETSWNSISIESRRVAIEASVNYFMALRKDPIFCLVDRFWPGGVCRLPLEVERLLEIFNRQREGDIDLRLARKAARAPRRVAFVLLGAVEEKCNAVFEIWAWLNLVINDFDFIVYLPRRTLVTRPNIHFRILSEENKRIITSIADTLDRGIILSGNDIYCDTRLPPLLEDEHLSYVLISKENHVISVELWQQRLAEMWYETWAAVRSGPALGRTTIMKIKESLQQSEGP